MYASVGLVRSTSHLHAPLVVNFFADPYAVRDLLVSPEPSNLPLSRFILLPLDITTPHELPFPYYTSTIDSDFCTPAQRSPERNPLVHFTSAFLERTRDVMLKFGKDAMELHDIAAVWCAIEHPPVGRLAQWGKWNFVKRKFQIER